MKCIKIVLLDYKEGSPSGLWRTLGKRVEFYRSRGFESLSLRQEYSSDPTHSLKVHTKGTGRFFFAQMLRNQSQYSIPVLYGNGIRTSLVKLF
jgi:hypothetical protein